MAIPNLVTVRKLAEESGGAFTDSAIRHYVFNSATNGLDADGVVLRIKGKVLIDRDRWFAWLERFRSTAA